MASSPERTGLQRRHSNALWELARTDLIIRLGAVIDDLVRSRWTLPVLVALLPLVVIALYPNVMYPTPYNVDEWLYISWARNFEYVTERWHFTYYFIRFGYTVPGNLIYSVLPDIPARFVWGLTFNTLFLASMAGAFRRLFGPYYALGGVVFLATDVVMLHRMSAGYVDGATTAYLSAAMYCTLRAADSTREPEFTFEPFRLRRMAPRMLWFFLAGLALGLSALTYPNAAMWTIPLAVLFLLRGRPTAYRLIAASAGIAMLGGLLAMASHMLIFHHFTGNYDFWRAAIEFARQDKTAYALPFSKFVTGFLHESHMLHIMPGTIVALLSVAVCAHAWRFRVPPADPSVAMSIAFLLLLPMLMAFQLGGTVGIAEPRFVTFTYPGSAAGALAFIVYARRYFGTPVYLLAAILFGGFVLWWPLRLLRGPGQGLWFDVQDITGNNTGLLILVAGLLAATLVPLAGRRPKRSASWAVTGFLAILLLLATGFRADDGWQVTKQGEFNGHSQYVLISREADKLIERFPEGQFSFSYVSTQDGLQGSLAWALNANFMFEYTQVTRDWLNVNCTRAKNSRDFVVAGNAWVLDWRAVQPILNCGVNLEYVDSKLAQHGDDFLYLSFYHQVSKGNRVASVSTDKLAALNGGRVSSESGAAVLATDPRQYAFSGVLALPPLTGPVIIRTYIRVTNGLLSVLVTRPDNTGEIVAEVEVGPRTADEYVDLHFDDGFQAQQLIFRNRVAQSSSAVISRVDVFQPSAGPSVPAAGIRLTMPTLIDDSVRKIDNIPSRFRVPRSLRPDLVGMEFIHEAALEGPGVIKLGAWTRGFYGRVSVRGANGEEIAGQALPRSRGDVLEIPVPSLAAAHALVFSRAEDGVGGELHIETAVIFSAPE